MPDGCSVTLQLLSGWALAAPAELPQDAPDVSWVIAHSALRLDQLAHPARSPQPGGVFERLGSALERVFYLLELGAAQSALAPSPSGLLQSRLTGPRKLDTQRITDCRCTTRRRATSL